MQSVLSIEPTQNYGLCSPVERLDAMQAFARVLKGLSHPLQLVSQARGVADTYPWPMPPRLDRRWLAVVDSDYERTLRKSLEGVGLRVGYSYTGLPVAPAVEARYSPAWAVHGEAPVYTSSLVLRRWPREVAPGWLGQALSNDLSVDVALHIQPQDPQWIARKLKRQQSRQAHSDDAGDMLGHRDAEQVRQDLIAHKDRPVSVAVVFSVHAPDIGTLTSRVSQLKHELGLTLADVREATFEQDRGLEATQPLGVCRLLGAWRTLTCTAVASTWLFQPGTILHKAGADLGTTHDGSMLVRLDPFDDSLESFGGVVLAKVGAGKSYLLKLLAMRLHDAEVLVVEQRNPPEFAGIERAVTFNLADIGSLEERAARLRDFVSALWNTAKRDPRPRLLILDELWSLLRDPALASLVEEIARIGRHHYLSLWIATQQVQELLRSDQGMAVLNNAAIKVYLKQNGPDGELLAERMNLSGEARQFLRGAARGEALLDVGGMLVPVNIQASADEHRLITTDPRERRALQALGA